MNLQPPKHEAIVGLVEALGIDSTMVISVDISLTSREARVTVTQTATVEHIEDFTEVTKRYKLQIGNEES